MNSARNISDGAKPTVGMAGRERDGWRFEGEGKGGGGGGGSGSGGGGGEIRNTLKRRRKKKTDEEGFAMEIEE